MPYNRVTATVSFPASFPRMSMKKLAGKFINCWSKSPPPIYPLPAPLYLHPTGHLHSLLELPHTPSFTSLCTPHTPVHHPGSPCSSFPPLCTSAHSHALLASPSHSPQSLLHLPQAHPHARYLRLALPTSHPCAWPLAFSASPWCPWASLTSSPTQKQPLTYLLACLQDTWTCNILLASSMIWRWAGNCLALMTMGFN